MLVAGESWRRQLMQCYQMDVGGLPDMELHHAPQISETELNESPMLIGVGLQRSNWTFR